MIEKKWSVGDFGFHVDDPKQPSYLLRLVVRSINNKDSFITEYIDQASDDRVKHGKGRNGRIVSMKHLDDPARYGIEVRGIPMCSAHAKAALDGVKTQSKYLIPPAQKYGKIGDYLYVREPVGIVDGYTYYMSTMTEPVLRTTWRWESSVLKASRMPKHMARCFLKIKNTWVIKLGEINTGDAIAEGIYTLEHGYSCPLMMEQIFHNPRHLFQKMWQLLHNGEYDPQALVETIEFERVY